MFLRSESKPDPKQQALDNVLMMLDHKKIIAPTQPKKMTPSYPPARDGTKNYEPDFNPKPKRKLPFDMAKLQQAFGSNGINQIGRQGSFNPSARLDASQVQDMRGAPSLNGRPNPVDGFVMEGGDGYLNRDGNSVWGSGGLDYPPASAPANGENPMLQILKQFLAGKKRTAM